MTYDRAKAIKHAARYLADGQLTAEHIVDLAAFWQAGHAGLKVDGDPGKLTRTSIEATRPAPAVATGGELVCWPLRALADGRRPRITSGHSSKNPSRPKHHGVDLFYPYDPADELAYGLAHGGKPIPTVDPPGGDAGAAAARAGVKRWWVPDNTPAVACAPGLIVAANLIGTGHRVWLDYGGGMLAGYMHLSRLAVRVGDVVAAGDPIGIVGDSTAPGHDARHLHFEIYRGKANLGMGPEGYPRGTVDPEPLLERLTVLAALDLERQG
jgi:murein DD-endopeptidase MepM/ murein hydrolase activator NlpD